jgi:group I intron endonuclease
MITNCLSNNIYIGRTLCFRKRYNNYATLSCKRQPRLYSSLRKYGFDNHNITVLIKCKPEELNLWEAFYIKLFDSFNTEYGMNLTSGGDAALHTEQTKEKIRKSNLGRVFSESTLKKISGSKKTAYSLLSEEEKIERGKILSKALVGIPKSEAWKHKMSIIKTNSKRSPFSQEWKDKIGKSSKRKWDERKASGLPIKTEGQIEKQSNSLKAYFKTEEGERHLAKMVEKTRQRLMKPVFQKTLYYELIKRWDCVADAARELKIPTSNITNCVNGKGYKSAGGFRWERAEA